MFGKKLLIVVVVVTLLLATLASLAMAASPSPHGVIRTHASTWSVPLYGLPIVVPGHPGLMGDGGPGSGGNGSC